MQYAILAPIDGVIAEAHAVAGRQAAARAICSPSRRKETSQDGQGHRHLRADRRSHRPARLSRARHARGDGARGEGARSTRARASSTSISAASSPARAICRRGSRRSRPRSSPRSATPARTSSSTRRPASSAPTFPARSPASARSGPRSPRSTPARSTISRPAADGTWAWPPMLFDNPVEKVAAFLAVMRECAIEPEFECFDTGIVRTAAAIARNNGFPRAPKYNFVMGVESGMPADPELLPILMRLIVRRRALERHRDRPRRNLAAAPARRRTRRRSAHRPRRHDLPARRRARRARTAN